MTAITRLARAIAAAAALIAATTINATAAAAALDPAVQASLLKIYDAYGKAMLAGQLDEALAMRSSEARQSMKDDLATAAGRKEVLDFGRHTVPDSFEVLHASLSKDGAKATIITLAHKKTPDGAVATSQLTLSFVNEGGAWKFGEPLFGRDPALSKHCPNPAYEPIDAFDQTRSTSLGGPIARVAFEADHTLVVVGGMDDETCVILPSRAALKAAGLDPDQLVPYAIVEFEGLPHKTDEQKAWAETFKIDEE